MLITKFENFLSNFLKNLILKLTSQYGVKNFVFTKKLHEINMF
jgi:hypothetical protein